MGTNRKIAQTRSDGYWDIRVFHRTKKGKRDPRFLLKCGCCNEKLQVYYGEDSLEINGVMGSVDNWRELLLPLLDMKLPGQTRQKLKHVPSGRAKKSVTKQEKREPPGRKSLNAP